MANDFNRSLERYDMSGKRKALMLCVKEGNKGATGDLRIMKTFFNDFGFEFEILIDRSVQEMKEKLKSLRDRINSSPENISCVLVVTTSHGSRGVILDPYNNELEVDEIIQCFSDRKCPKLRGKPKIFMIDACRGSLRDIGVSADQGRDRKLEAQSNKQMLARNHREYMNTFQPPTIHDMLVFYPTRPDYVAYMTSDGSSMFVKMSEVLASADTEREHLRDLFVKVNKKMVHEDVQSKHGARKNVMTTESTLTKAVYLGRKRGPSRQTSDIQQQSDIVPKTWDCILC